MSKRKKAKSGDIQIKKNAVWIGLIAIAVILLGAAVWVMTQSSDETQVAGTPDVRSMKR